MTRSQLIHREVMTWPGVEAHAHRFGGTEYRLGNREIGHIHGDSLVDVPLPKKVRDEVVGAGLARPHHVLPQSGWVSVVMRSADDAAGALGILRRSYDLARAQRERRSEVER